MARRKEKPATVSAGSPFPARSRKGGAPECAVCRVRGTCFFLSNLEPGLAEEFVRARTGVRYRKRQLVYQEGLPAPGVYCVCAGLVKVYQSDGSGHELILNLAGPGEVAGHTAVLGDLAYSASAETIEESVLSFIEGSLFRSLVERSKKLNKSLLTDLARYVNQVSLMARDVMMKSSRQRVRELLVLLATKYGRQEKGVTVIDLRLSRQDMGNLIGLAQETVVRLLSGMEKEGLLELKGSRILIRDPKALQSSA